MRHTAMHTYAAHAMRLWRARAATAAAILLLAIAAASCGEGSEGGPDTFTTPSGKRLVITPIKHSSLQIQYDGREYDIDPVQSAVRPIINYTDKPKAEFVIVTHDHYDHFDMNAIFLLTKNSTNVILTPICYNRYKRGVPMRNGMKAQLTHDVWIYSVPAYNTTPARRSMHPKGWGNGYVIDFGGFRVYVAGDTEYIPEMKQLKDIDVAFLPCDPHKTMSPRQLRLAAKAIRPKVVYPYHMGTTPRASIAKALAGLGIDVRFRELY